MENDNFKEKQLNFINMKVKKSYTQCLNFIDEAYLKMLPVALLNYFCQTGRSNVIVSTICYLNFSSVH